MKIYSFFRLIFLSFMLFCFLISGASALLLSPAVLDLAYDEGGVVEFDMLIVNDIPQDIVIEVTYQSFEGKIDYTDYFSAEGYPTNKIPLIAGSEKKVHFTMKYPELEQFGDIRFALMRFYQVPFDENAEVGATVAILIPLDTTVPYPEKYVKVNMESFGTVAPGDSVPLEARLTSLGSQVIEKLDGSFVISNGQATIGVPFDSGLTLFLQEQEEIVTGSLSTVGMESGKYEVFVSFDYDGETKESDPVSLIIGEKSVEILGLEPETYEALAISPVTVTLLNLWVEDVSPSISLQLVSEDGSTLQSSDFGTYTLPVAQEKKITGNLDLENIVFGVYTLRVVVNLEGEEIIKDFPITVLEGQSIAQAPEEESDSSLMYIVGFALLIVIVLCLLFFFWYKKRNNESDMEE